MADDPVYTAVLKRAEALIAKARHQFRGDDYWKELPGNVPKVRTQVWVDALKNAVKKAEDIERIL
jgi:hypothetical protein